MLATLLLAFAPFAQDSSRLEVRAAYVAEAEDRLRAHGYFKEIAWQRSDACAPPVLFLQQSPLERPNHEAYYIVPHQLYETEFEHTGDEVISSVRGSVFLLAHSDVRIEVERLEIVGVLPEAEFARLEADWVAGELARMGF